jgi:hypothetical protein
MLFEASDVAVPAETSFSFETKVSELPKDAKVATSIAHDVDVAENGNQKSFYSVTEERLPVKISAEAPVKINLVAPQVPVLQTGSLNLKVVAERKGDFKGPINLALLYTPPGIGTAGALQIKEGETETFLTLSATADAAVKKWKVCVVGSADAGSGQVWVSTQMAELEVGEPFVTGKIGRAFVDQAETTTVTVKLEHKQPFDGKAKLALLGLPPGCTSDEREITKDDQEVQFTVKAAPDSPVGQHKQLFCQFRLERRGEAMISTFGNGGVLRIDQATVAKAEVPTK